MYDACVQLQIITTASSGRLMRGLQNTSQLFPLRHWISSVPTKEAVGIQFCLVLNSGLDVIMIKNKLYEWANSKQVHICLYFSLHRTEYGQVAAS